MSTVTISKKFQVVIPRIIREAMKLRQGNKVEILYYDNRIELMPIQPLKKMRGFLKGMDTYIERKKDRL